MTNRKYNVTLSHEARFIWYRVAKVGTRTILAHLRAGPFNLDVEQAFGVKVSPDIATEYFSFAFVRNPWERLVSCYKNKIEHQQAPHMIEKLHGSTNFEDFVKFVTQQDLTQCDPHFRLQSELIDLNTVNFIGRHERFANDLLEIFSILNIQHEKLFEKNTSGAGEELNEFYTPNLIDKVAKAYKKDIQCFGYEY